MKRQEYDHSKLEGHDADIETCLKEYGFAWIETPTEFLVYYGIRNEESGEHSKFDFCTIEKERNIKEEHDWISWKDVNNCIGMDIMDCSLMQQYSDLISYYGYMEIFGSCYWEGLTYDQIIKGKWYGKKIKT